jgi:hypothetical protein
MKTRTTASNLVVNRTVPSHPAFMQKYSDEVRERIAKKAYELDEQRRRHNVRELKDWLEAEELVRKEMDAARK